MTSWPLPSTLPPPISPLSDCREKVLLTKVTVPWKLSREWEKFGRERVFPEKTATPRPLMPPLPSEYISPSMRTVPTLFFQGISRFRSISLKLNDPE